jgi:TPR repeat protein
MKLLLEKLSRYWQLRFLAVGAGVVLVIYAVMLPDPSNKSRDTSILSVAAAPLPLTDAGDDGPMRVPAMAGNTAALSKTTPESFKTPWLGENNAVADQLDLAVRSYSEADLPRDFSQSIRALHSAADHGDTVAEFLLGHAYQLGLGVSKDMTETARWYARAAAGADSHAVVKDFPQAFDSYSKVAEQGDAAAQLYLGLTYDLGRDIPRNVIEAARWYRKAAAQGSSSAASNLGVLYYNGDGMPKDSAEAAVWFSSAATRGNVIAQYCLGRLYYQGEGVPQDYAKAAAWFERAAAQGSAPAQVLLSAMYATGKGVPGSTPKAYMWINLASGTEDEARTSRVRIEKVIPPDEIAEGQKLTHDWLLEHSRSTR